MQAGRELCKYWQVHSEVCRTPKMEFFTIIINGFQLLTIFVKHFLKLDVESFIESRTYVDQPPVWSVRLVSPFFKSTIQKSRKLSRNGTKCFRMDQVKFVGNSLYKNWRDMVYLSQFLKLYLELSKTSMMEQFTSFSCYLFWLNSSPSGFKYTFEFYRCIKYFIL